MLISDFMSSEESDDENEDIIIVKPLVWRSERVTQFLQRLDEKCIDVNSLTTVGYLLEVFIRLWIPSMVRIFTSAWS